ncbi:hypothetical protein FAM09_12350 [Niastella caeni]|uniref:Uncharacterized protein n=1 Tax=Niastella caeni TaxID=2569763 RepID=A0A4S8HUL0_9BACT|nr:hypothetical protein [Niastella caeni]THU39297.1 hypothetical protein FAM09_12350 [Niastella caeni]
MIRLISTLLVCHLALHSFGQIEEKTYAVLKRRDFNAFKQFAGRFTNEKDKLYFFESNTRDLVEGYQESIFYIKKSYPFDSVVSASLDLRINIIANGNLIIQFYLESQEFINFPASYDTKDTSYTFSDTARLAALKARFQKNFFAPLNEKELFVDSIFYGIKCGRYKQERITVQQAQIRDWVKNRDTTNLFTWLQSTNTEKQVYAVQGFHSLTLMGVKISDKAKKLIEIILKKKGTINTCGSCTADSIKISVVVSEFTQLLVEKTFPHSP